MLKEKRDMETILKMAQEGKIGLTIDRTIWKKLSKLKIDKDFKTFDDVLIYLLKSCSTKRDEKNS